MKEHQICQIRWLFMLHAFILSQRNYMSLIFFILFFFTLHHISNAKVFFVYCVLLRDSYLAGVSALLQHKNHAKSNDTL